MKKIQAVCFDMDGVIIDTEPLYEIAETKLFKEYGVEIPKEDWVLFKGCNEKRFYDLSMERYEIKENKEKFIEKGREYIKNQFDQNLKVIDGFIDFHRSLKKNKIKTALVTASPKEMFDYVNSKLRFDKIFNEIVYGGMTKKNKPNPAPYLYAMKQMKVSFRNSVIIEDSLHGIKSGLNSGAYVIGFRGSIPEEQLHIANYVVSNYSELSIQILENKLALFN